MLGGALTRGAGGAAGALGAGGAGAAGSAGVGFSGATCAAGAAGCAGTEGLGGVTVGESDGKGCRGPVNVCPGFTAGGAGRVGMGIPRGATGGTKGDPLNSGGRRGAATRGALGDGAAS